VSAQTFAEILNSFVEPLSYKAMLFVAALTVGGLLVSNVALSFLRARLPAPPTPAPAAAPHLQPVMAPYPYPSPQRTRGGGRRGPGPAQLQYTERW
jgi:hypothetical protein